MFLSLKKYKSAGLLAGENAGGSLGAPFECIRGGIRFEYHIIMK